MHENYLPRSQLVQCACYIIEFNQILNQRLFCVLFSIVIHLSCRNWYGWYIGKWIYIITALS